MTTIKVKGFNSFSRQGSFNRRYHGGIATSIHDSIPAEALEIVTISDSGSKSKPEEKCDNHSGKRVCSWKCNFRNRCGEWNDCQLPEPVIIMGDLMPTTHCGETWTQTEGAVVGSNYHSEGAEPDEQWVSNTQLLYSDWPDFGITYIDESYFLWRSAIFLYWWHLRWARKTRMTSRKCMIIVREDGKRLSLIRCDSGCLKT